jgi:hypothetical protein
LKRLWKRARDRDWVKTFDEPHWLVWLILRRTTTSAAYRLLIQLMKNLRTADTAALRQLRTFVGEVGTSREPEIMATITYKP